MSVKLITILLLFSLPVFGQNKVRDYVKKNAITYSLMFGAGGAQANCEALTNRYPDFKKFYGIKNDQYWNPAISWTNKYQDNDPKKGPAFWGSTSCFVAVTDGYHLVRCARNQMLVAAVVIQPFQKRQKWYMYLVDFATVSVAYSVGFNLTYELITH
jgi:hypothetical protein